jgi:uncharacterized membrane protein YtjA (UPF0391 family)
MVRSAILFFVLAVVAYAFGAYGIAGISMDVGKILLTVFLVLAVISFIVSVVSGKKIDIKG